jgi:hypothetical protein
MNTEAAIAEVDPRTRFQIPRDNFAKFEKEIGKLSRRAMKIAGFEILPIIFGSGERDFGDGVMTPFVDVYLDNEVPKMNGWTFVATIDHSNETGNIVRSVPNVGTDLPEKYRTAEPVCDHCGVKRYRRDTYVLRCDADGDFKQVGKTCLKDFFGHDPAKIASMAELLGYALECARGAQWFDIGGDRRYISTEEFLNHSAWAIRKFGWVSAKQANADYTGQTRSTRARAMSNMIPSRAAGEVMDPPTEEDIKLATDALEWAQSLKDRANLNDYEHNVMVVAQSPVIEVRACGIAASIVSAYLRVQGRLQAQQTLQQRTSKSKFVGTIGKRTEFGVVEVVRHVYNETYGTHIYTFLTDDGDLLVWLTGKNESLIPGTRVKLKGTVKKHSTYKDVAQTNINRCVVTL